MDPRAQYRTKTAEWMMRDKNIDHLLWVGKLKYCRPHRMNPIAPNHCCLGTMRGSFLVHLIV